MQNLDIAYFNDPKLDSVQHMRWFPVVYGFVISMLFGHAFESERIFDIGLQ